MIDVAAEGIVLFGFSVALLSTLQDQVPAGSVLVIEEPDVAAARGVEALAARCPAVSRVIGAEYQDRSGLEVLLAEEPALAAAAAVLPGSEYAVVPAAIVAERIGVRGAGVRAARTFRDKFELRQVTSRAGIGNPRYALVGGIEAAEDFFERTGGSACVLKPTARQASAGVQFITEPEQLRSGWQLSADPDEGHRVPGRGVPSRVMIEQALDGPEFSVEVLVVAGGVVFANVTAKQVRPGRFPVELGHMVPAAIPPALNQDLVAATERLVTVTGLEYGILHSEWIVTESGPVLIEGGARMPGDAIGTLISQAWGFDLTLTYLRLLLGEPVVVPARARAGSAIVFFSAAPGRVVAVEGVERARARPGVCEVNVGVGAGTLVAPVTSSWDRAGYVRVVAATAAQAGQLAEQVAAEIEIIVREPGPDQPRREAGPDEPRREPVPDEPRLEPVS